MKKREAKEIGKEVGLEILTYGDFTDKEKRDEESFSQAYWEIVENRKQYADDISYDLKRDYEWEGYEEGLAIALNAYIKENF